MNTVVLGAGAVGCFFGGLLAEAGHSVTLIGRAVHVERIQAEGLRIETASGRRWVRDIAASTGLECLKGASLVLCCTKSAQIDEAAQFLGARLNAHVPVLSLQNGLTSAERLRKALPNNPVWPALVYAAVGMNEPGVVAHRGGQRLCLDARCRIEPFFNVLSDSAIECQLYADMEAMRWHKLLVNCALNALSAISQSTYGALLEVPALKTWLGELIRECVEVARACGIEVGATLEHDVLELMQAMAHQRSSTAQDLARGRPTEIDEFNGFLMQKGREHGVLTPINTTLYTLIKALETPSA
ncbi:ketopantoate reductase family protein [Larsenimonas suaedae]|uniref:2-dehydropantoate 2-reductase n=1 Tax=Larsenimonas suaedae TaxID=1851019 RepID=A0ABU1GUD4_9GAMM|nr:ketopantoate reductase family protein [Larsenimonas suaedae]MCM2970941.1 ketopantoate reductase family protein [Larsenimonas suaedae]MDR5895650.1 ketopantoate reductase family protein [Larsenimonas suaedae]